MYKITGITLLMFFFLILCNNSFTQYRTIVPIYIIRNAINRGDSLFLSKYGHKIYYSLENNFLSHHYHRLKKPKKEFHINPYTKLVVYRDGVSGNMAKYNLLKTDAETNILAANIHVISIKKSIITFEISYYESSKKDILPDVRQGQGITTYRFDEHLVRIDTIAFKWSSPKKKWFPVG